jgi:hypothetical protein
MAAEEVQREGRGGDGRQCCGCRRSYDGRGIAAEEERANDRRQSERSGEVKDEERLMW